MAKYEVKDGVGIIPEWATEIEAWAFYNCEELTSVVIPQWVRKIDKDAFYNCIYNHRTTKTNQKYPSVNL